MNIYNMVPSYEACLVDKDMFKEDVERIVDDFKDKKLKTAFLVIPRGSRKDVGVLPKGFTILEARDKSGLVYQNSTALLRMTEGEKPIPYDVNDANIWISAESLREDRSIAIELDGKTKHIEIKNQSTIREILHKSGVKEDVKAVWLGHPSGAILSGAEFETVLPVGVTKVRIILEKNCILDELLQASAFYRQETCGRCVFGHEGTWQIFTIIGDISNKKGKNTDVELLRELSKVMLTQTVCEVCSSLALSVLDATEKFAEEINAHIIKRTCPAGSCTKFVTFHILADKCTGCMDCIDVCDDEAIEGKKKFVHVINQSDCTQCGACLRECSEGAIVTAGAIKPRTPPRPVPCKR